VIFENSTKVVPCIYEEVFLSAPPLPPVEIRKFTMRTEPKKLSKQQKQILKRLEGTGGLPVSLLYKSGAANLRSVQASVSRAVSRLQARGLVERISIRGVGDRNVPGVRLIEKS